MPYSSTPMNRYWIPSQDIHKKVITQELQYHLGPEATVRAFTREGEDGFLITTPGPCLSDEQIDDICEKSREMWELKAAARSTKPPGKPLKRPLHQPVTMPKTGPDSSSHQKSSSNQQSSSTKNYSSNQNYPSSQNNSSHRWN